MGGEGEPDLNGGEKWGGGGDGFSLSDWERKIGLRIVWTYGFSSGIRDLVTENGLKLDCIYTRGK